MSPEGTNNERLKDASGRLLLAMADLQDSLSLKLESSTATENITEKDAVRYTSEAFTAFVDSAHTLQTANPRSIRDKDRAKILPGQHSGVYLQFGIPNDGSILIVNFMGGLRILSSIDLQDSDRTGLKRSHTKTTDKVLEQNIEINWQLSLPGGPKIDTWLVLNRNQGFFQLNSLEIDGTKIDAHPTILRNEKYFDAIKTDLSTAMRDLTSFVPSSS